MLNGAKLDVAIESRSPTYPRKAPVVKFGDVPSRAFTFVTVDWSPAFHGWRCLATVSIWSHVTGVMPDDFHARKGQTSHITPQSLPETSSDRIWSLRPVRMLSSVHTSWLVPLSRPDFMASQLRTAFTLWGEMVFIEALAFAAGWTQLKTLSRMGFRHSW